MCPSVSTMRCRVLMRLVGATDMVEDGGDLRMIVGVLVPHHEVGCGGDGPGLVPVDLGDLRGPLPAVVGEVEVEPAGAERTDEAVRQLRC